MVSIKLPICVADMRRFIYMKKKKVYLGAAVLQFEIN